MHSPGTHWDIMIIFKNQVPALGVPKSQAVIYFGIYFFFFKDSGWLEMFGSQLLPFWLMGKLRSRVI